MSENWELISFDEIRVNTKKIQSVVPPLPLKVMRMLQPDKISNTFFLRLDPIFALFFEQLFYALCFASTFTMINYFRSLHKFQMFIQVWIIGRNSDWRFYSFNLFHRFVFLSFDSFNRSSDFGFHYTFLVSSFIQTPELNKKLFEFFKSLVSSFTTFQLSLSLSFILNDSPSLIISLPFSLSFQQRLSFKLHLRQHFCFYFHFKTLFLTKSIVMRIKNILCLRIENLLVLTKLEWT